jgi:hypothetical protein
MSLKEIGAINDERSTNIMSDQLRRLEKQTAELEAVPGDLQAKIASIKSGKKGPEPVLGDFGSTDFDGTCE